MTETHEPLSNFEAELADLVLQADVDIHRVNVEYVTEGVYSLVVQERGTPPPEMKQIAANGPR
jgi:hypothetical protein